jgi:alkylhydroperoxidase family enzyme
MPHIDLIDPNSTDAETAELFRVVRAYVEEVPPPLRLFANNPKVAQAVFNGFGPSMSQSSLSQPFFAWIRYLVADSSDCTHCVDYNGGVLLEMGVSQEDLTAAKEDPSSVPLDDKEKALLLVCLTVVKDRSLLEKQEIEDLKQRGLTNADLVTAVHHTVHSQATDLMINAFGL